jgi:hypothetical protein
MGSGPLMKIAPADAYRGNFDQNIIRSDSWFGNLSKFHAMGFNAKVHYP